MTDFNDIRPYKDDEVTAAIQRLLNDDEFITAISRFKYPKLPGWLRQIAKPLFRQGLKKQIGSVSSVHDVQIICESYLDKVIEGTTTALSFSGLEHLTQDKPHLFISNHRDIVMDPAFFNYALYHNGIETGRIAIGDNLLQKPFVSDLMRLNKSFIVKRSAKGVREKLNAYINLSSYIHHSIAEGHSIWIAQREGRAKDGIDQTEPAIIKMLYMSQRKSGKTFSEYINWLNIIPTTISYEYNPCDKLIARELYEKSKHGSYTKTPGEDINSIVAGITGNKGEVHVAFGPPLSGNFDTPEEAAAQIDLQMAKQYVLQPSNYLAAEHLGNKLPASITIDANKRDMFNKRLESCDEELRDVFLRIYANSILKAENEKE